MITDIYKLSFTQNEEGSSFKETDGSAIIDHVYEHFDSLFNAKLFILYMEDPLKGEPDYFPNDILLHETQTATLRICNKRNVAVIKRSEVEGETVYDEEDVLSYPYIHAFFDNRPNHGYVAIERAKNWNYKTEKAAKLLGESFDRIMQERYNIRVSISLEYLDIDYWEYIRQQFNNGDYIKNIKIDYKNKTEKSQWIRKNSFSDILDQARKVLNDLGMNDLSITLSSGEKYNVDNKSKFDDIKNLLAISKDNEYVLSIELNKGGTVTQGEKIKITREMNDDTYNNVNKAGQYNLLSTLYVWFDGLITEIEKNKGYANIQELK